MAAWSEIEAEAPALAGRARELFDARKHKTLATLRRDGSPRISGIEATSPTATSQFGSMRTQREGARPPARPALRPAQRHRRAADWTGDAKVAGLAHEVRAHHFRGDIRELVVVYIGDPRDHLVIASWHEGRGVAGRKRY